MTRERALKVLEMFLDKQCSIERTLNHMDTTDVEIWDAVYTAREALSAEPCEDAISRAEVYAMLKGMLDDHNDSKEHQMVSIAYIEQELSDLPSVTPTCSGKPNNCEDAISRAEAIRIASGYCHWTNIPDELAKLPSVTPKVAECEDAIDRAWLKEAIHNFYCGLKHTPTEEDIQAYIDAAPSVNPKQKTGHWIPVSERLPENIGDYLVTYDYTNFRKDFKNTVGTCWWSGKERGWQCEIYLKVVAWMSLPEPYKAESEDKE